MKRRFTKVLGSLISSAAIFAILLTGQIANASIITTYDTSLTSPPGFYNGSGNPNTNFTVATNGVSELGLSSILRFAGPIDPGAGSNTYIAPAGSNAGKALWDFEFSVNTRYNGGTATLSNFIYLMTIMDITTGIQGAIFDPVRLIPDNSGYGSSGKTAGVNLATEWGAENAENLAFAGFFPGFNPNAPDLYKITLSSFDSLDDALNGKANNSVSTFTQVSPTPEPGYYAVTGLGLVGLLLARKRMGKKQLV